MKRAFVKNRKRELIMSIQQLMAFGPVVVVRGVTVFWPKVRGKEGRAVQAAMVWANERGLAGADLMVNGDLWRGHVPAVAREGGVRRGGKVGPVGVELGLGI